MKNIPSDIQIAQKVKPIQILDIARAAGIRADEIQPYGTYKAKISLQIIERLAHKPNGKLIIVTSMTPTRMGEGKTSTAIGLTQALAKLKKKTLVCLREPSLGPAFGIKGGGCGGGYSQILPMEDINLHFTGDIHAVGAAHNLLAAILCNHILKGNQLNINIKRLIWNRVIDTSDRFLRNITIGQGGRHHGIPHESRFDITASSEIMAILALTCGLQDLKKRLSKIIVAYTKKKSPVTAKDLKAVGAMAVLLKDAIKPNLVQTIEGQPVFVHAGPFANIAHGNSSLLATSIALKLADYVVTESGFGSDLGCEKFFDIVCRLPFPGTRERLKPSLVVLMATAKALKLHGGADEQNISLKDVGALKKGLDNLKWHIDIIRSFGIKPVVAINRFPFDDIEELQLIRDFCNECGIRSAISEVVARGGEGGIELAKAVLDNIQTEAVKFKYLYELDKPIMDKIKTIATRIYGASAVVYTDKAKQDINNIIRLGLDKLPINMAKTHLSLTDDPKIKDVAHDWKLKVKEVRIQAGAGFIVPITGKIVLMPGLPGQPAAERIGIDEQWKIKGLF